jgi:thioredoxin reductase (NADPH)
VRKIVSDVEDLIIVGSGPAGYTAAIYAARAKLKPLCIEGVAWGGLLQETTDIENFPGFPRGLAGPDLMEQMRQQAERFGTRFITDVATTITPARDSAALHTVCAEDREYHSRALILAMGSQHKKLNVSGEAELSGRGVSYCATCDAALHRGGDTVVVGGGDSAMEEAIFLARFAATVTIVGRRSEFRASPIMIERARAVTNIAWLTPYAVDEFIADSGGKLSQVLLHDTSSGEPRVVEATGAFVTIGHEPQSLLVSGQVALDGDGYVLTDGKSSRTNRQGVFAAGDLVDRTYRQAVTAAGSGCQAALDAQWYLRDAPAPASNSARHAERQFSTPR